MNPFSSRITRESWIVPVSVLSLVLGFMLTLAWLPQSNIGSRVGQLDPDQAARIRISTYEVDLAAKNKSLSEEVAKLREEKTRLENAIGDQTKQAKILNDSLQELKLFAGLSPVQGPGVVIVLSDSEKSIRGIPLADLIIHDTDVLRVVNELWAAGAEAVAIGDYRFVGGSSVRCVGPAILVDNNQVSSPIKIRAIGDPETLYGGLNMRGGVLDELRSSGDTSMVRIEKVELQTLPAYSGPTLLKYVKPVEEPK